MSATSNSLASATAPDSDSGSEADLVVAPASTSWVGPAAAVIAITACMLNGRSAISLALLTLFTGAGLLLAPPKCQLPRFLRWCFFLCLAACACSLLPAHWFGDLPKWRRSLVEDWGTPLTNSLSPQPALSLGGLLTLATAGWWFILILGSRLNESSRRLTLQGLTLGIYLIAALALAQKFGWLNLHWPLGSPTTPHDLGPFSNRNHFSSFCAIGCVLGAGMAHDAFSQKSRTFLLYTLGILIPFTGIVLNSSRAGLLLFFIGLTLWLNSGAVRSGFFRNLAVTASLVFGAASILIVFGGGSGARLADQGLSTPGAVGRLEIYEHTFQVISHSLWTGFGLGNFDAVFALQSTLPINYARVIHPESDWLWCWVEIGLLGILPLGMAILWLLIVSFPSSASHKQRRHHVRDRRLRTVACIGLLLPVLHGLVDVPLHGLGFSAVVLVLAACAVPGRKLNVDSHLASRLAYRVIGLCLLALGSTHVMAINAQPLFTNYSSSSIRKKQIQDLASSGKFHEALQACNRAIHFTPLDWSLYFERGFIKLQLRKPSADALDDFNRVRFLEPKNANICEAEARLWLKFDPPMAIMPWRELLSRTTYSWQYGQTLQEAQAFPELTKSLRLLATTPAMKTAILSLSKSGPDWDSALKDLLDLDPNLSKIDLNQRKYVLALWQQRGDRDQLVALLESHPEWHADSWSLLADEYARKTEFEKAWNLQRKYAYASSPQEVSSGTLFENLERNFALKPTDARLGVDLYFAQKKRGLLDEASRTLDRLQALPDPPSFLILEKAALFAERKDFRRAYETMKSALAAKPK
jgi:O-antigen ligase